MELLTWRRWQGGNQKIQNNVWYREGRIDRKHCNVDSVILRKNNPTQKGKKSKKMYKRNKPKLSQSTISVTVVQNSFIASDFF